MKVLRVALAGLGRIGWQFHLPALRAHAGFSCIAASDPLQERRQEAEQALGLRTYADFSEMLAGEALDLVVLASPTHLHARQAVQALHAGIDVFCDKPLASSLAEADQMIAAAQATGRKLMVYQPMRVEPQIQIVQALLRRGLIGQPYMIKLAVASYYRRNDWQTLKQFGGGALNNAGSHWVDHALQLAGGRARDIHCWTNRIAALGDAEDVVKLLIETDNGVLIDLDLNNAAAQPIPTLHVLGRNGSIAFEPAIEGRCEAGYVVRHFDPQALPAIGLQGQLAASGRLYGNPETLPWQTERVALSSCKALPFYDECYAHFALDAPAFVPLQDTREVMRVLHEAHRQAKNDHFSTLNEKNSDPLLG